MKQVKQCPSFSVIRSASDGDETAMEKILNHYNAYISKACLRPFYDEYGNMQLVVDMEIMLRPFILLFPAWKDLRKIRECRRYGSNRMTGWMGKSAIN